MNNHEDATSNADGTQGRRKTEEPENSSSVPPSSKDAEKPTTLAQHHWDMLITESGIRPDLIQSRGYRTVTKKSHVKELGFKEAQSHVPALLIPIFNVQREIALYQARPDEPRIKEGKPIKYETLAGSRMVLDCHPIVCQQLQDPTVPLWITEGIKKGDCLVSHGCCAIALLGVWNWRGTNEHGGKTALPDWESIALNGRLVCLAFDSDVMTKLSVYKALSRLKGFLETRGARVSVIYLPSNNAQQKLGVDDFLAQGGLLEDLIALATSELRPPQTTTDPKNELRLPVIETGSRHMRDITTDAIQALLQANTPPTIFLRGTVLARLQRDEKWLHSAPLELPSLKGLLDRSADFIKTKKTPDGEEFSVPVRPPTDVVADILSLRNLPFPALSGIATIPLFLPDGTLLVKEGYHTETGLFLSLGELDKLNADLSISEALSLLLEEVLVDFPFVTEAGRTHAIALFLQPFLRQLIHGPTPLYLIHAPQAGTGKDLLAEAASLITTGLPAPVMALTKEEAEIDKRVTSLLMASAQMVLLDNVTRLTSSTLAAVLTAEDWKGRILGKSQMVTVPNKAAWTATGNNVELSNELVRRTISIRLDAGVERPEDRQGFKHEELLVWVSQHRSLLVRACLSIIHRWVQAGMPLGQYTLGRFESWARVMGGIMDFCECPEFLGERELLRKDSDQQTQEWVALCQAWYKTYEERPVTAKDLFTILKVCRLLLDLWGGRTDLAAQQRLGHALSGNRDRVFGSYRIRLGGKDANTGNTAYRLEQIAASSEPSGKTPQTPETSTTCSATVPPSANGTSVSSVSSVSDQGELHLNNPEVIDLVN